jgi:hypothetical protein
VCYSDSTCEGYAASTHIADTGNEIRGTQEYGIKCVVPSGYPTTNIIGANFLTGVLGSGATGARIKYWVGSSTTPTLTKTGLTVPHANISSGTHNPFLFDAVQSPTAGTTIRITLAATGAGSAGNGYNLSESRNDLSGSSTGVHPWNCVGTGTTDGTNFTDGTDLVAGSIILDATTPFTVTGGSGGGSRLNQVLN